MYKQYARQTARHHWHLIGSADTLARAQFLNDCFKKDAPTWEVTIRIVTWESYEGDISRIDNLKDLPGLPIP